MKIYLIIPLLLTGCVAQQTPQSSNIPLDMKAVQEYQKRVITGKTVSSVAKQDEKELNHSDRVKKSRDYHYYPMVYPNFYYYGLGYYR